MVFAGYTLSYMKKNKTITKVTKDLSSNILNYTIQGLTATTTYTIAIHARTRVGPGLPRSADIESGIPPGKPRNVLQTKLMFIYHKMYLIVYHHVIIFCQFMNKY